MFSQGNSEVRSSSRATGAMWLAGEIPDHLADLVVMLGEVEGVVHDAVPEEKHMGSRSEGNIAGRRLRGAGPGPIFGATRDIHPTYPPHLGDSHAPLDGRAPRSLALAGGISACGGDATPDPNNPLAQLTAAAEQMQKAAEGFTSRTGSRCRPWRSAS